MLTDARFRISHIWHRCGKFGNFSFRFTIPKARELNLYNVVTIDTDPLKKQNSTVQSFPCDKHIPIRDPLHRKRDAAQKKVLLRVRVS